MHRALTPTRIRVLRRVRDGELWSADNPLENELREAMFLAGLGLLDYPRLGVFKLTSPGVHYLKHVEESHHDGKPLASS